LEAGKIKDLLVRNLEGKKSEKAGSCEGLKCKAGTLEG
jgi:hypothetical protein